MNKDNKDRFAEPVTSTSNIPKWTDSLRTKDSNKPLLTSIGVNTTTSASGITNWASSVGHQGCPWGGFCLKDASIRGWQGLPCRGGKRSLDSNLFLDEYDCSSLALD
ncbi:hypothetical protein Tco_0901104 [Tanacetum coccineum]